LIAKPPQRIDVPFSLGVFAGLLQLDFFSSQLSPPYYKKALLAAL
jgi:hypothetical protein